MNKYQVAFNVVHGENSEDSRRSKVHMIDFLEEQSDCCKYFTANWQAMVAAPDPPLPPEIMRLFKIESNL